MKVRLLFDYILIEPTSIEETTKSGIILIQSDTNKAPTIGKVVAIGPGRFDNGTFIRTVVKLNDKVMWHKFAGSVMEVNNIKYMLMHESDLTCVIE
ncbi:co-chaperone GroES [Candidatus Babeliales bacterium]|nr:co-chaperone GroES [Candidatus Babeliales bacterium]